MSTAQPIEDGPERDGHSRYYRRFRVPLDQARELWRRTDLYVSDVETHTIADPVTGEPVRVEMTKLIPVIFTPELLGWSEAELEGIEDDPAPLPPPRPDVRRPRPRRRKP